MDGSIGLDHLRLRLGLNLWHVPHVVLVHVLLQVHQLGCRHHPSHHLRDNVRKPHPFKLLVLDHLLNHGEFHHLVVVLHVLVDVHVPHVCHKPRVRISSHRHGLWVYVWHGLRHWRGIFVLVLKLFSYLG